LWFYRWGSVIQVRFLEEARRARARARRQR